MRYEKLTPRQFSMLRLLHMKHGAAGLSFEGAAILDQRVLRSLFLRGFLQIHGGNFWLSELGQDTYIIYRNGSADVERDNWKAPLAKVFRRSKVLRMRKAS